MMNEFRTAKEAYDQTPIPQELNDRVQAGIRQGSEAYRSAHRRVSLRRTLTTAAACFVVVVGTLPHRGGGCCRRAGAGRTVPDPDGPQL